MQESDPRVQGEKESPTPLVCSAQVAGVAYAVAGRIPAVAGATAVRWRQPMANARANRDLPYCIGVE